MADIKVKQEHQDKIVAFGGGGKVALKDRKDLHKLAAIGLESGDPTILDLFEGDLPSLEDLKRKQTDAQLKNAPAVAQVGPDRGNTNVSADTSK